jgi:hypothetical protein
MPSITIRELDDATKERLGGVELVLPERQPIREPPGFGK